MSVKKIKDGPQYKDVQASKCGVYAYIEVKTNKVAYIGLDNDISTRLRHRNHLSPARIDDQVVNRELQTNPDKYRYEVIAIASDKDWMEDIEAVLITVFKAQDECKLNQKEEL